MNAGTVVGNVAVDEVARGGWGGARLPPQMRPQEAAEVVGYVDVDIRNGCRGCCCGRCQSPHPNGFRGWVQKYL